MPVQTTEARERITMRIPRRMRETLEEAASISGATVNQFMLQSAYDKAQRILESESVIRLAREQAQKVWDLVQNPPKPNARLRAAYRDYKKNVRVKS